MTVRTRRRFLYPLVAVSALVLGLLLVREPPPTGAHGTHDESI